MHYLGLDVGGTTIKAGVVDETGAVLEQSRIATVTDDWNAFRTNLVHFIRAYQERVPIRAIGIGVPGFRNSYSREILTSPNIPCLVHASVERLVADEVHLPVITENDANAAAYGEFVCGNHGPVRNMVFLTLGTGLGSGLILDGKLFTGTSGYAAEFGHTIIQPDGRSCGCGSKGCLETLVSATGVVRTAMELLIEDKTSRLHGAPVPLTSELIFEAAVGGDTAAISTFARTGYWLGLACVNLINTLNLQMILIGGGVMGAGRLILDWVIKTVDQYAISAARADCQIVQSKLWRDAGLIGAAMLARDTFGVGRT